MSTTNIFQCAGIAALLFASGIASAQSFAEGAVYTSTNETDQNRVAIFTRATDGTATLDKFVLTGGTGSGATIGNQGAVTISSDEKFLFVTNAGSDDLSVFKILDDGLALIDLIETRGDMPVSVAQHDDLVYVVHEGDDSISGFQQRPDGTLVFLRGSRRSLSGAGAAPAQIGFSPEGDFLFVTERATQLISRYRVTPRGSTRRLPPLASEGVTPFGFTFGVRDQLFVSEAATFATGASSLTSYELNENVGELDVITPSLGANQTSACWVVGTPSGRIMFVSNTGEDTVSSFGVDFDGTLSLLDPVAATVGDGPRDISVTRDGRFFYVLNAAAGGLGDYTVGPNGSLVGIPGAPGDIPTSASGLAVR